MTKFTNRLLVVAILFISIVFQNCKKEPTVNDQAEQGLAFYYPPAGLNAEMDYEIMYPWGTYVLTTGAGPTAKLSAEREAYRGYMTMRAFKSDSTNLENFPTYLVTKEGEVWICDAIGDVERKISREEVVVEEEAGATMTSTSVFNSSLQPIVNAFKANPALWKRYGKLESSGNDMYKLVK
jgi:hypothetical protein